MFAQLARRAAQSSRNFTTSAARRGEDALPAPGDNLPFSINNRYLIVILVFCSDIAIIIKVEAEDLSLYYVKKNLPCLMFFENVL